MKEAVAQMTLRKSWITAALLALAALSAAAAPDAVRQAREQLALFNPEAARRAMADLKSNPKYDWAKHNAAVEALIAKRDFAQEALAGKDTAKQAEAVALVEAYRAAMLANPVLDFDKILCVHRKLGNPRGAFGGGACGMVRLNAENQIGRAHV